MSFVIFGDTFTFPEGGAATNRVHTYAKGFLENGSAVHIICFSNNYSNQGDGVANGIHYYHPLRKKERSRYFFVRRWHNLIKYYTTFRLIRNIDTTDKIIAINSWTQLFSTQLYTYFLAKCVRTKLISEHSEHPLRHYQGSFCRKKTGEVKAFVDAKLCDGIFCISEYLMDFYRSRGLKTNQLLLVPSTVDTERFRLYVSSPLGFPYILYCGGLTIIKDGVDILIKSFTKLSGRHPEVKLVLLGKADPPENEVVLRNLVIQSNLTDRVLFLGQLSRNDVPAYLVNATILALARPTSLVADAGFPSKLTEYLACGKPVVVTKVGEIPVYLKDQQNAFISEPDSADAFADKLEFVLKNYTFALEVSARGRELTETVFNYNFQAKRMLEFIKSLK